MLFFKRILDVRKTPATATNRRENSRFVVNPGFPVNAVLNIAERDGFGKLPKARRANGRDWSVQLINLSTTGARLQVPAGVNGKKDDFCRLKLDVQGYQLIVPGRIAHVAADGGHQVFGLLLDLGAANTADCYRQLIDLVALGSSLALVKPAVPDASGYLVEEYAGEPASRLRVWRDPAGRAVTAFEFLLKDCLVRGLAAGAGLECYKGTEARSAKEAKGAQGDEIKRLYQWVVLNLAPAVPADVQEFLRRYAA